MNFTSSISKDGLKRVSDGRRGASLSGLSSGKQTTALSMFMIFLKTGNEFKTGFSLVTKQKTIGNK